MSDDEDILPLEDQPLTSTTALDATSLLPPPLLARHKHTSSSSRTRPVVKLVVTSVTRSYSEPWRRRTQRESGGTGFLIPWTDGSDSDGGSRSTSTVRILTNAHVVRNASSVRARSSFGPHVVNCEVEWISLPLDLALVKISDGDYDDFCKGWGFESNDMSYNNSSSGNSEHASEEKFKEEKLKEDTTKKELKLLSLSNTLPSLDSNVTCVGFPMGGKQISVTRGVISRIDVDALNVLRIQIDAAINPGNSGGPVFDEQGQVVGISTSVILKASNIGYIIPGKVVHMFLQMCRDGMEANLEDRFCGLGSLVVRDAVNGGTRLQYAAEDGPKHVPGITNLGILGAQNLESKALRRHLGLEELDLSGGVRIVGSRSNQEEKEKASVTGAETNGSSSSSGLQCNDVLLAINNEEIGYDGTIQLSPTRPDERINFRVLVTSEKVGTKMTLDVLRSKKRQTLEVTLDSSRFLVPQYDDFDASPLYAVCGGCVFAPLTLPLVNEKKSSNTKLAYTDYYKKQRYGHEQIIVLSKVLNDEVNVGYHGWANMILKSVNGHECQNIQELVNVLTMKIQDETLEFHFENTGSTNSDGEADWLICMSMQEVSQSESRILSRHMIASWCSTDAISREVYLEVEKADFNDVEKSAAWSTMGGLRKILCRDK